MFRLWNSHRQAFLNNYLKNNYRVFVLTWDPSVTDSMITLGCYRQYDYTGLLQTVWLHWVVTDSMITLGCYRQYDYIGLLQTVWLHWVVTDSMITLGCYNGYYKFKSYEGSFCPLNMGPISCPETSLSIYHYLLCYSLEQSSSQAKKFTWPPCYYVIFNVTHSRICHVVVTDSRKLSMAMVCRHLAYTIIVQNSVQIDMVCARAHAPRFCHVSWRHVRFLPLMKRSYISLMHVK
jgi:hypothetical protein